MKIGTTFFNSIKDNKTSKNMKFEDFDEFEEYLYELASKPGYKPSKDETITDKCSMLFSPAMFKAGSLRRNVNVKEWHGWAALDVDDYEGSPDDALKKFKQYYFICYSTASSTKKKPKFRLIFPLSGNVPDTKIKHFWYALNTEVNSLGDPQTKDMCRMYYVPATYPNAFNFIFTHKGRYIDPYELMGNHAFVEKSNNPLDDFPPEIQKQILEYRASKLTNYKKNWTSIHDCKYIPQRLVAEYRLLNGTGWYNKLYIIMCAIAYKAIEDKYNITSNEIEFLIRQLDSETGNWYKERPIVVEAERAIAHAMQTSSL